MALSPKLIFPGNWPGTSIQRMATTLISNQVGTHTSITSEWPWTHIWSCDNTSHSHIKMALSPRLRFPGNWPGTSIQRMAIALISDQVGTHPSITSEWPCTYIWSCETTSHSHIRMALSLRLSILGNWPGTSIQRMAIALIFDHVGTNPTVTLEWLNTHIWHGRSQSFHHDRMATGTSLSEPLT